MPVRGRAQGSLLIQMWSARGNCLFGVCCERNVVQYLPLWSNDGSDDDPGVAHKLSQASGSFRGVIERLENRGAIPNAHTFSQQFRNTRRTEERGN